MKEYARIAFLPFGDAETGEHALAIAIRGVGVAFCYDAEQARDGVEAFEDILETEGKRQLLNELEVALTEEDSRLPAKREYAPPLEVRRDLVGEFFVTLIFKNAEFQDAFRMLANQRSGGTHQ
jgi:hypothetical protein